MNCKNCNINGNIEYYGYCLSCTQNHKVTKEIFKPIALIYPETAKKPIFIGYYKNDDYTFTVRSSHRKIVKNNLINLSDVYNHIETEYGWHPAFKWMTLYNIDSLTL